MKKEYIHRDILDALSESEDYEVYDNQLTKINIDMNLIDKKYRSESKNKKDYKLFPLAIKVDFEVLEKIDMKEIVELEEVKEAIEKVYEQGYLFIDLLFWRVPICGYVSKSFTLDGTVIKEGKI